MWTARMLGGLGDGSEADQRFGGLIGDRHEPYICSFPGGYRPWHAIPLELCSIRLIVECQRIACKCQYERWKQKGFCARVTTRFT